jgi:hypothetical protein
MCNGEDGATELFEKQRRRFGKAKPKTLLPRADRTGRVPALDVIFI